MMIDIHEKTLQYDSSLNDLDVDSKSQAHEKARTYAFILMQGGMK